MNQFTKLGLSVMLAVSLGGCKLHKATSPPIQVEYKVTSVSVYPDNVFVSLKVVSSDEDKVGSDGRD